MPFLSGAPLPKKNPGSTPGVVVFTQSHYVVFLGKTLGQAANQYKLRMDGNLFIGILGGVEIVLVT